MYKKGRKISRDRKKSSKVRSKLNIPLNVFLDRKLSFMESVVYYMKDNLKMTYHEIALSLNRDDRTIWTVYNRALKKKKGAKKSGISGTSRKTSEGDKK